MRIDNTGIKVWKNSNNRTHNLDGPATIIDENKLWYIYNIIFPKKYFNNWPSRIKIMFYQVTVFDDANCQINISKFLK